MDCFSTETMMPEVGAWIAAETLPSASAISCPFKTFSPKFTFNLATRPTCWRNGRISFLGILIFFIGWEVETVFLVSVLIPPLNLKILSTILKG